jgi:hypothetical protein
MTTPLINFAKGEALSTPTSRTVKGKGGGLADFVPATIDGQAPAALSEGEYVIPADVVSMLGDGSSDAGARVLDKFVEQIRVTKQGGTKEQAPSLAASLQK